MSAHLGWRGSVNIQINSFIEEESENSRALGGPSSIVGCPGFFWRDGAPAGSPPAVTPSSAGAGGQHHTHELSRNPQLGAVHLTLGPQGESKRPRAQPTIRVTTSFLLEVKLGQLCGRALPPAPHSL